MRGRCIVLPAGPSIRVVASAQLLSVTGTQVTALALPTLAVLTLDASPLAASALFALEYGVQGLTAPLAGVAVDAIRSRRRLLVLTDVIHGLVVATVPVAYGLHHLSLGLLFTVAAFGPPLPTLLVYEVAFGYCATVWTIGSVAFQQSLVPADQLGRVLALTRSLTILAIPVGALGGGALATTWGLLPTLTTFAVVALAGTTAVVAGSGTGRRERPTVEKDRPAHASGTSP